MKKLRISLDEARLGMRLAHDVFGSSGQRLLAAGKALTPTVIEGLRQHLIFDVDVLVPISRDTVQTRQDLVVEVQATSNYLEDLMAKVSSGGTIDYAEAEQAMAPVLFRPEQGFQVVQLMTSLYEWHHYTYNHGVAVAALAATVGNWMELDEEAFFELAMAGYLHDLGKALVPQEVLNKPSSLDEHEWEEARKHPVHAYELLRNTPGVPEKVIRAIYEHHERNDGSGYPRGLVKDEISLYGRILAACDVFHALTSRRAYKHALSPFESFKVIEGMMPHKLDAIPVKSLICGIMSRYRGKGVILSNGQQGRIVHIDRSNPAHPIVATKKGPIDLATRLDVYVEQVLQV